MNALARPERILVRCPNWLGDVVMATPGLRALRRAHPNAWIVCQVPNDLRPLLEGSDVCDELWPIEPRGGGWARIAAEARRVADAGFDLGILVPESISSALRMRWGGVRRTVGFARDPIRRALLHEVVPAPTEWGRRRLVSRERYVLQLVQSVGAEDDGLHLGLRVTVDEQHRLDRALEERGLRPGWIAENAPIVLAPGAGFGPSKCWPATSYAELADRFAERGNRVVLVGGAADRVAVEAVAAAAKSRPIDLGGALDVGALKALVRSARLLVANDSGVRHLAAAFRVPNVVFFGPTSVAKTSDNLHVTEVLETDHACRPCYKRECPIDHRCLRSISADTADMAALRAQRRAAEAIG